LYIGNVGPSQDRWLATLHQRLGLQVQA
jgi:hypothetical protein